MYKEQQRLVEFKIGDVVKYRVMANTVCVVTAVCRRKFMTKHAFRINNIIDAKDGAEWNWIGQQLVRVRCINGFKGIEDHWEPANLFTSADDYDCE
jgi:hypothetical protein